MANYFKPRVSSDYNDTIVFGVSNSNRTKDFGLVRVLGYRHDRNTNIEVVWANMEKLHDFPAHIRLKNVQFGYVPSGKSSTDITWVDDNCTIPIRSAQYICYRGIRIRKSEYDKMHRPNQQMSTYVQRLIKGNRELALSLPSIVAKYKQSGMWDSIGSNTQTSTYLNSMSPKEFLSDKTRGQLSSFITKLTDLTNRHTYFRIPKKALAVSYSRTFGGHYFQQLFYENQSSYVSAYEIAADTHR